MLPYAGMLTGVIETGGPLHFDLSLRTLAMENAMYLMRCRRSAAHHDIP